MKYLSTVTIFFLNLYRWGKESDMVVLVHQLSQVC